MKNKRIHYTICFVILFFLEVTIAVFVHDRFIRPYIGDVLVVPVVYCLIRIAVPGGLKKLPLYVFLFAAAVEIMQYFNLVKLLGLSGSRIARIVMGSTFDIKDIICYGVGAVLIVAVERFLKNA